MKIKKILASVLGLALTASVLAGCSSGNGSTAESGRHISRLPGISAGGSSPRTSLSMRQNRFCGWP